jgi:hypothetical protein
MEASADLCTLFVVSNVKRGRVLRVWLGTVVAKFLYLACHAITLQTFNHFLG